MNLPGEGMPCFTKKMVSNPRFPRVSERVTELKILIREILSMNR